MNTHSVPPTADPVVAHLSDRWGGPAGEHVTPRRKVFWNLPRILTALTVVGVLLSLLASQYCRINGWSGVAVYHHGCYSDVAALWAGRDFAISPWAPFDPALAEFEYPALTTALAALVAALTHGLDAVFGSTALSYWDDRASLLFWDLTFLLSAGAWLVVVLATMAAAGTRRWDAVVVAVSPAVIFGMGINWDIFPAAALALAIVFHQQRRYVLTGVMIGIGVSFKIYPLFMLGALFTLAARRWYRTYRGHSDDGGSSAVSADKNPVTWPQLGVISASAAGAWVAANIPIMLLSWEAWSRFFVFSSERGAGYSSVWHAWMVIAEPGPSPETVSLWSLLLFAGSCAGVLILGALAPQRPRMVQLLFLIVAAFVICSKVYSPQFMIWLVPLMVLAAPRMRDLIIWHAAQLLHFWAVWMYLAGVTGEAEPQHTFDPSLYVLAVAAHLGSTIYIAVQVCRDILNPERDPVRTPTSTRSFPAGT